MRPVRCFVLFGLLLAGMSGPASASIGPAVSFQHLLRDSDCEAVPALLGDWTTQGDLSGAWALQPLRDRNYRLIQKEEGSVTSDRMAFDICVAHLGGYLFFDAIYQPLQPDGKQALPGGDDDLFWIPLHLIGRLETEDNALHFRLLDDGWLQEAQKSARVHLTCSRDDEGGYVMTAPSTELKQFAAQFASDPKAFSDAEDFTRAAHEDTDTRQRHESLETPDHAGGIPGETSERANMALEKRRK